MDRMNLKQDHAAQPLVAFTRGRKHVLTHRDRRMRIRERGVVRRNIKLGGLLIQIDRHGIAFDLRREVKAGEELHGQLPKLDRPVLHAEDDA